MLITASVFSLVQFISGKHDYQEENKKIYLVSFWV